MNHNYRLIWNATHRCWQAVSELAKGKGKSGGVVKKHSVDSNPALYKIGAVFILNLLSISVAIAAPSGGVVTAGTATIGTSGTTTTINQSTAKAAIDWSSFSTSASETVNFVQPNSNAITLNRVVGTSGSTLNGKLNANGQVFIINPNGVLFGTTSQVNVGGLVTSTLGLDNTDFLNGNYTFSNPTNNKEVDNKGKITVANGGTVALLAPTVRQTGTITAPEGNVLLAAGSDITLNLNNGSLLGYTINQGKAQALINSGGLIQADAGKVILTAKGVDELSTAVVNSVGVIQARTVSNVRGVIELGADMESGTLNVGGVLDASAPNGGNGGQIKTQAANVTVSSGTNITTSRLNQSALPPTNSGWELRTNDIDVEFWGGNLTSSTLSNALENGNVTLKAVQGDINLNDSTGWTANTALTLDAAENLNFNSDLDLSGDKAKLVMNYGTDYDYNLNNGARINITGANPLLSIKGTAYTVINELGEEGDPNFDTLQGMQNNLTGNYALGSDIDASDTVNWNNGKGFDPIGQVEVNLSDSSLNEGSMSFRGNFHGLGHQIENLIINNSNDPNSLTQTTIPQGLFSAAIGDIRDIGLVNAHVKGDAIVGALVGLHYGGIIKNAYSKGSVEGFGYVGGLIGAASPEIIPEQYRIESKITDSYSESHIKGQSGVGGLVGVSETPIYNSYATGNISLSDFTMSIEDEQNLDPDHTGGFMAGGLVGIGQGIYNSYATGNITMGAYVNGNWYGNLGFYGAGGLTGAIAVRDSEHYVDNSYATGNVSGIRGAGGLAGITIVRSDSSPKLVIKNSYATGNIIGSQTVGGLVGGNAPGNIIEGSYSTGNVTGTLDVGGLLGDNNGGIIRNSYTTSTTIGETNVGGLIGINGSFYSGQVENSYATGDVTGENQVGGLLGAHSGTLENSYSTGAVTGATDVGGLIGYQDIYSTVTNSYWNTDTSGQLSSAGGTGKTTAELQQIATFSGWDIADVSDPNSTSIWVIDEDNAMPWLRQFN